MNPSILSPALPKRETYTHVAVLLALAGVAVATLFVIESFAAPLVSQPAQTQSWQ